MKKYRELYLAKKDVLLTRPDITGVFYGFKTREGQITDQPALIIQVQKKYKKKDVVPELMIPSKVKGLDTDVIEGTPIPSALYAGDTYLDTIQPGASVGPECMGKIGTLGIVAYDVDNDYAAGIVSNHHVLVDKNSYQNPYIKQPGNGSAYDDRIAELHGSKFALGLRGDFAFATLSGMRAYDPVIYGTGMSVTGAKDPEIGDVIEKVGRTTGYTQGQVFAFGSWTSDYSDSYTESWYGDVTIDGFVIAPLSDPNEVLSAQGDSGALWYDSIKGIGVGINTAGSSGPSYAYASFLTNALADMNLSVNSQPAVWKPTDDSSLVATLMPPWATGNTPQYFDISFVSQRSLSNVGFFTDPQFVDPFEEGIIWIKRGDTYIPVGATPDKCNIGNISANVPISLTIMIKNSNNLSLAGNYVIPLYVGHGNTVSTPGSWLYFTEAS